jgi:hypothetical protein
MRLKYVAVPTAYRLLTSPTVSLVLGPIVSPLISPLPYTRRFHSHTMDHVSDRSGHPPFVSR